MPVRYTFSEVFGIRWFPRRLGRLAAGAGEPGHPAPRRPFSESTSRRCTGTLDLQTGPGGGRMPITPTTRRSGTSMRHGKVGFVAGTCFRAFVLGSVALAATASAQDEAKPPATYPDLPSEIP